MVALTLSSGAVKPFQALATVDRLSSHVNQDTIASQVEVEQLRSTLTFRFMGRLGFISASDMRRIHYALGVYTFDCSICVPPSDYYPGKEATVKTTRSDSWAPL